MGFAIDTGKFTLHIVTLFTMVSPLYCVIFQNTFLKILRGKGKRQGKDWHLVSMQFNAFILQHLF